jgi:hypothetical protein
MLLSCAMAGAKKNPNQHQGLCSGSVPTSSAATVFSRLIYVRPHRAARRIRGAVRGSQHRRRARRGERLFRRLGRLGVPARSRRVHGVPADHHGAGGDRDLQERNPERDHRDHDSFCPALRLGRALIGASRCSASACSAMRCATSSIPSCARGSEGAARFSPGPPVRPCGRRRLSAPRDSARAARPTPRRRSGRTPPAATGPWAAPGTRRS